MATPPPPLQHQPPAVSTSSNQTPQSLQLAPPPSAPVVKSEVPSTPAVKSEIPAPDLKEVTAPNVTTRSPETSTPPASYTITIPSNSAWFSFEGIHETERKILPEFFDGKVPSRNPRVYKYIRDSIIKRFRRNPSRKITFTEARRCVASDVLSIRKVFEFLEYWGLINYTPSAKPLSKEKRDVENVEKKESPKKLCSSCRTACTIACFATDKSDVVLCARCFVRGNYRPGLSSTDFKRVDISEETKTDWTDKETLHLLEAVLHYAEDWKKVAEHVGSRNEKECVARFIRLPFGEQFMGPLEVSENCMQYQKKEPFGAEHAEGTGLEPCLTKRRRLTPLADASNPILAQVAFLSAVVGSEVAGAAAQAAISTLDDVCLASIGSQAGTEIGYTSDQRQERDDSTANAESADKVLHEAVSEAESQLEKEQQDVERSITDIVELQLKTIQEKIRHFEELELQMEKEWLQVRYMKDLFFADQLALVQHKAREMSAAIGEWEKTKTSDVT